VKALFLDRDGVICRALPRKHYLVSTDQFELMPEIVTLIRHAKTRGYRTVVVTNQPQIAYGLITPAMLDRIHLHMQELLGHSLDAIYACPHQDSDGCACRKPKPGLITRATHDLRLDPSQSVLVGDRPCDIEAAHLAGCGKALLLDPLHARPSTAGPHRHIITNLLEALPFLP
jgi:histidinol-phosphate phosphatase family protein